MKNNSECFEFTNSGSGLKAEDIPTFPKEMLESLQYNLRIVSCNKECGPENKPICVEGFDNFLKEFEK